MQLQMRYGTMCRISFVAVSSSLLGEGKKLFVNYNRLSMH